MQPHHWRTEGSQLPAAAYNGSLDHAANVHNAPHPLLPVVMGPGKLHLHRLLPTLFPTLSGFCAGPALKAEEGVAELRGLSEPAKPASEQCALTSQSLLPLPRAEPTFLCRCVFPAPDSRGCRELERCPLRCLGLAAHNALR